MNEDKHKVRINSKTELKRQGGWQSYWIKPKGKFWKRYFNKKVRNGKQHKRGNWFEWS
jgi:hypothetical protein